MNIIRRTITYAVALTIMVGLAAPANACQLVCMLTIAKYNGNLGGMAGANAKCNTEYPGFKFARSVAMLGALPNMNADSRPHAFFLGMPATGAWVSTDQGGNSCMSWTDSGGVASGAVVKESGISLPEGYRYYVDVGNVVCSNPQPLVCCNM